MKQANLFKRVFVIILGLATTFFMGIIPKDGEFRTNVVIPTETKVEKEPEDNTNPGNKKI